MNYAPCRNVIYVDIEARHDMSLAERTVWNPNHDLLMDVLNRLPNIRCLPTVKCTALGSQIFDIINSRRGSKLSEAPVSAIAISSPSYN
jgi:hypothetical protein